MIAEIETEKALVEMPAEKAGIMGRFLVTIGQSTAVGAPVAVLLSPGEDRDAIDILLTSELSETILVQPLTAEPNTVSPNKQKPDQVNSNQPIFDGRIFISPIARKIAKENSLDISALIGSGIGGRIIRADVERAIAFMPPSNSTPGSFIDTPHNGMRRAIARRLTESKSTVPHFYITGELNAEAALNLRQQINTWSATKISVTDLLLKTVAAALSDVPQANVIWTAEAIRQFADVDIAIAVATERGLVTPVLRGVNQMTLAQTSVTAKELIDRARTGRLKQEEIEGGTFSITNLGMYGTQSFSAILNPPQSAILAVGAASEKPVVINGRIEIAQVITFTLSVDHRALDGAVAAQWFAAFTKRFENPMWLVMDS